MIIKSLAQFTSQKPTSTVFILLLSHLTIPHGCFTRKSHQSSVCILLFPLSKLCV